MPRNIGYTMNSMINFAHGYFGTIRLTRLQLHCLDGQAMKPPKLASCEHSRLVLMKCQHHALAPYITGQSALGFRQASWKRQRRPKVKRERQRSLKVTITVP